MFPNVSLLFAVSFLVCILNVWAEKDKAALKLLNSYDLDELVEKLAEFDLDQDGQLSEVEVELQQPGIQTYLDRYEELQKAAEEEANDDDEDESDDESPKETKKVPETAQKTEEVSSQAASSKNPQIPGNRPEEEQKAQGQSPGGNVVEDEDDGVEIETVEEMEIVEDDGSDHIINKLRLPVITAAVVGVLTILMCVLCTFTKKAERLKQLQKEEHMQEKRAAWLNRLTSNQQGKSSGQTNASPALPSQSSGTPQNAMSCVEKSFSDKLNLSKNGGRIGDEKDSSSPSGRQLFDVSNTLGMNDDSRKPSKRNLTTINKELSKQSAKSKVSRGLDKLMDSNKPSTKPQPPAEKTADIEKLKSFLEKAFNCNLSLSDELSRMRFSGGNMRVPTNDFPSSLDDLSKKMESLTRNALDRVDKVKFAISVYNACDAETTTFHDNMVDSAAAVIREEAVRAVMAHFQEEKLNAPQDDGLWDFCEGFGTYETYNFLPRLIGHASDGVNISQSMLSKLVTHEKFDCMVSSLLHIGGSRILALKRMDEITFSEGGTIQALEMLIATPSFGDIMGKIMKTEIDEAVKQSAGNYFQESTAVCELLNVSTLPGSLSRMKQYEPSEAAQLPFRNLRSFPNFTISDIETAQTMIQTGTRQLQQIVFAAFKKVMTSKSIREVGLSWFSTLISFNELRTTSVMQENFDIQPVCRDGFMLNICSVLLDFCLPICQDLAKLNKVDLGYSASPACRLLYDFEACLGGGQLASGKDKGSKIGMLPSELQGQHSFITECFHLTQRALSVSIVPTIKHFQKMQSHYSTKLEMAKGTDQEQNAHSTYVLVSCVWETSLMDPDLVRGITTFYISQATLLLNLVNGLEEKYGNTEEAHKAQRKALSVIPEFCVKDMAQWFTFLASHVLRIRPNVAKGISLTPFVDCCVMLLERPDLMPGPVPASMIVSALLAFMKKGEPDDNQSFRSGWGSGVMSDLAAMVHTCPSVQTKLAPALLRTYVSVDVVEGLDVDKDTFDKFGSRVQISQLVQKLWSRADCRASIINLCGTDMFQNFLDAILDTLLYKFHDSLGRLANVKKIEKLKENESEWNALSRREQMEKDSFLRSEESVGSGFMRQAKKTLKFLNLISQSEKVARCLTQQPLAARAASTINGFLDSLCGAKAKNFNVKDKAKYEFSPVELLQDIMNIILRIVVEDVSRTEGYLVSMVKDPDFELANMEKACNVIIFKGFVNEDIQTKLTTLTNQMRMLAAEHCAPSAEDENDWRDAFEDLEIDKAELEKQYKATMLDERFNMKHIRESHCFIKNLQEALDARAPKIKVLMKEMTQMSTSLPVHADASIFVRQDKERMDVMRALVTGPADTPYSLGCFCFDIYFPGSYPNVPPLVKIITTGNGTVRFNPNLYADGKVCLSLLGTWHAGDASEKWTPGKSSLYQVLVSIQSMILTPDPVFNEPGYERIRDSEEGNVQSRQYNWKIHLQTLRHAILGQLKNPPPGFERVIRRHFALQREALLKQCAVWVKECEDPDLLKHMRRAADSIFHEVMNLDVDFDEKEVDSEDEEDEDDM